MRLPNFICIGAQKAGTTFLYEILKQHPQIFLSNVKEPHFFDSNFKKGLAWYLSHFTSPHGKVVIEKFNSHGIVTGEATPYYIFHPHAPRRISELLPYIKLIVLLRNPVDRAYSHYHHSVRRGIEFLSFEDAIGEEGKRLNGETEKLLADENYRSYNHQKYSYLSRGMYVDQLALWFSFFSKEQLVIIKSEEFFNETLEIFKKVEDFLNLPHYDIKINRENTCIHYPKMNDDTRRRLIDYFKPCNQRLYEYLGIDFGWDK